MNKFIFLFALILLTACGDNYAADESGTCNFDLTSKATDANRDDIVVSRTYTSDNESKCHDQCKYTLKNTSTSDGSVIEWTCKFQGKVIESATPNKSSPDASVENENEDTI